MPRSDDHAPAPASVLADGRLGGRVARRARGVLVLRVALPVVPVRRAGDFRALAAVPAAFVADDFDLAALAVPVLAADDLDVAGLAVAALAAEGLPVDLLAAVFLVVDRAVAGPAALDAFDELDADLAVGLLAVRVPVDLAVDLRVVDFLVVVFARVDPAAGFAAVRAVELAAVRVGDAFAALDLVPEDGRADLAAVALVAALGAVDLVVAPDAAADLVPADALVVDFFATLLDSVAGRAVAGPALAAVAAVRVAAAVLVPVRLVAVFLRVVRRLGTAARNPRIRVPGLIGDTAVAAVAAADPTSMAASPNTPAALPAAASARSPMRATSAATSAAASPA